MSDFVDAQSLNLQGFVCFLFVLFYVFTGFTRSTLLNKHQSTTTSKRLTVHCLRYFGDGSWCKQYCGDQTTDPALRTLVSSTVIRLIMYGVYVTAKGSGGCLSGSCCTVYVTFREGQRNAKYCDVRGVDASSCVLLSVMVTGTVMFKGFMLQARDASGNRVGTFSLAPQETQMQLLSCDNVQVGCSLSSLRCGRGRGDILLPYAYCPTDVL